MDEVKETILDKMKALELGIGGLQPYCFWGAPGIGKTSVAEMIISAWNEDCRRNNTPEKQKSIIVIDCAQQSIDGFTLPVVNRAAQNLAGVTKSNLLAKKQKEELLKNLSDERRAEVEELLKDISIRVVDDTPKTWLPVFNPDSAQGDKDVLKLLDNIANGRVSAVVNDNDDIVDYDIHTNGGIIVIDELLRNADILHLLMSLIKDRKIQDYILGSKWYVICCSNRPGDDATVERAFKEQNDAFMQRLAHVNLIPSPEEWKAWSETKDYFKSEGARVIRDFALTTDSTGLEYLYQPAKTGAVLKTKTGRIGNAVAQRSPRNWAYVIKGLDATAKVRGVDILDLPFNVIERELSIIEDNAEAGVIDALKTYLKQRKYNKGVDIRDIVTKEDLNVPDTINESFNENTIEGYVKNVLDAFRSQYPKDKIKLENLKPVFTNMAKIIEKSKIDVKATRIKITELVQTIMNEYVCYKDIDGSGKNKKVKFVWRLPILDGATGNEMTKKQNEILSALNVWIGELDNMLDWDTFDGVARKKIK